MAVPQSALVVLAPAAEAAVGKFREAHDPSATEGMPAHITLLYPFKPPGEIDAAVLDRLRQCFAAFAPFHYSLAVTRRFPDVLYLAPEPDHPFRRLTLAVWQLFPETPPYGGRHANVVPHLTLAQLADGHRLDEVAAEFERASRQALPIRAMASEVALMDNSRGRWQVNYTFRLCRE